MTKKKKQCIRMDGYVKKESDYLICKDKLTNVKGFLVQAGTSFKVVMLFGLRRRLPVTLCCHMCCTHGLKNV